MNPKVEEIIFTVDREQLIRMKALATLRRLSVEQLVEETMNVHMLSVNVALGELSRNIFRE